MGADTKSLDRTRAAVGQPIAHDSARLHVSGQASYTDDIPEPRGLLHLAIGVSDKAHARIRSIDLDAVIASPGVVETLLASDIPGDNNFGPIIHDDPILVEDTALFAGHQLFAVAAQDADSARRAARQAVPRSGPR